MSWVSTPMYNCQNLLSQVLSCKAPPELREFGHYLVVTDSNYLVMTVQWPVWNQLGLSPAPDETGAM